MRIASVHKWARRLVVLLVLATLGYAAFVFVRERPQDLPWTELRLDQPIGFFTGRKLAGLTDDRAQCLALLSRTGLEFDAVTPHEGRGNPQCAVPDAVRLESGQAMLSLRPNDVAPSCPVIAALAMWEWQVVTPAAQRIFGTSVAQIQHFGSYSCRRLYGRESGDWSEHATADAIDISGFTLADGRRITVAGDWEGEGKEAEFLRAVRDGACELFATVLSPDYNEQHRDHLHLDQAERGEMGWRACR